MCVTRQFVSNGIPCNPQIRATCCHTSILPQASSAQAFDSYLVVHWSDRSTRVAYDCLARSDGEGESVGNTFTEENFPDTACSINIKVKNKISPYSEGEVHIFSCKKLHRSLLQLWLKVKGEKIPRWCKKCLHRRKRVHYMIYRCIVKFLCDISLLCEIHDTISYI